MTNAATLPHEESLFGHPKGLFILFFTEMWERFSYYGMRALLTLYMYSRATGDNPGLGWDKGEALHLYGWYTMMVYVASIPGGIIADRLLGQKKCVLLGGLSLCVGHGIMAIDAMWAFYAALALIVVGVGLLKPNISTMVGGLYPQGDPRRDKGFTIFYMGINIGAAAAALIVGVVGETMGWHYGFGLAGIGMALGQIVFMWGQKYLTTVGNLDKGTASTGGEISHPPLTKIEKDRVKVLLLSFIVVIVFWGAFEQAGGLMNIYTKQKVDRSIGSLEIPASVFQSLNPIFIILFGTLVAGYWFKRKRRGKEASSLFKMGIGTMIMGLGFVFMVMASEESEPAELVGKTAEKVVTAAVDPSGGGKDFWELAKPAREQAMAAAKASGLSKEDTALAVEKAVKAALAAEIAKVQAAAPAAIATIQGEEKPDPAKVNAAIEAGIVWMGATKEKPEKAIEAAKESYNFGVKASTAMFWIILAYLFHTIGELCASPVALSFITKLSPAKYASIMMGVYFAVTGLGNKVAGMVGSQVESFPERSIFTGITIFTIVFGLALIVFLKPLKKMTHGAEDENID